MAKKITIRVTEDDIANSKRMSPFSCPVATALKRTLGKEQGYVSVGRNSFSLYGDVSDKFSLKTYRLSPQTCHRILAYDLGESMKPFSFTFSPDKWRA